jgi:hypothetical protein
MAACGAESTHAKRQDTRKISAVSLSMTQKQNKKTLIEAAVVVIENKAGADVRSGISRGSTWG